MSYPLPRDQVAVKLVAVGDAGCSILNGMVMPPVRGMDLIALNTDKQALRRMKVPLKFVLGDTSARDPGVEGDPTVGQHAATVSADTVRTILAGADMIIIVAGLGGATGTGAAPIIAQIARSLGALTVGMVTMPFSFEGARRRSLAEEGASLFTEKADTLVAVRNDRLLQVADKKMSMQTAFLMGNEVLRQGLQRITDSVCLPGAMRLDFTDLRRLLEGAGIGRLATAHASGAERGRVAAVQVSRSPLLEETLKRARRILVIIAAPSATPYEVQEVALIIQAAGNPTANIVVRVISDPSLADEVEVTLITCDAADPPGGQAGSQRSPDTRPPAPRSSLHFSGDVET